MLLLAPSGAGSQQHGAIALGEAVLGLGVNTRVLMIGAHPDDEDTNLITWLSRGRQVTTAYLSLTRGDGGQNIIGNELGEALGVLRTEELLAARRIDGAWQYFTRAYDFGFSKDTLDTFAHWPRDTILGDVVRVVRAFRPHVIVAVFTGTPRDGHGQHQVSGILARNAYDVAGDTVRFPVEEFGQPWVTPKFYRAARGNAEAGTLGMDVGEYSPLRGESYGEIAGRSRSQHKSQAFGSLERKGPIMNYVRREATRVNESVAATAERSMFDGIDTTWARFQDVVVDSERRAALDSLPLAFRSMQRSFDPLKPTLLLPLLYNTGNLLGRLCAPARETACAHPGRRSTQAEADLQASVVMAHWRVLRAMEMASGITIEASTPRELVVVGKRVPVAVTIYNRGTDSAIVIGPAHEIRRGQPEPKFIAPGGVLRDSTTVFMDSVTAPWWLAGGRGRGIFNRPGSANPAGRTTAPALTYLVGLGNGAEAMTAMSAPVMYRFADDVRGEIRRDLAAAPAIAVTLGQRTTVVRANALLDYTIEVHLRSADTDAREARVSLSLPAGLMVDSAVRTVTLPADADRAVAFRVRGRLPPGRHQLDAVVESEGERFARGYDLVDYEHIRRQRLYRPASTMFEAVDVRVPRALRVAYVSGVSDNVAPILEELGISTTIISAAELARADLSSFSTVVIGPRAYDANPELINANPKLFDFARAGGTVVVQYGQYEMTRPGYTPFPITISRPHDRVTHEDAPVTILDPNARELTFPNRITAADFDGWVQERSLYMPRTFDERYRPLLAMSDPGENSQRGAILIAPMGQGRYVYTSLAFFRQLPAGVPGATRLFVNLLSAGLPTAQ